MILKDSLGIPHFDTEIEYKIFCSAFLTKKEYIQDKENDDLFRVASNTLKSTIESLRLNLMKIICLLSIKN